MEKQMADEQSTPANVISELRQLRALIEETEASLRSQREILKMRGMNLPPMAMQALSALTTDLASLERDVISEHTELSQLRFLADTSAMINTSLDVDTVLDQAMDVVISLTGAERGYLVLIDSETGELEFRVRRESELTPTQGSTDDPQISQTVLREVVDTGEPLLADNAYKDERLQSGMSIAQFALRSVLCVPLTYKDNVVGVVYVDNRMRTGVFEERERNLLMAFANQASVAIENARLYERIQNSLAEIREVKELMDDVFASIGSGVITADHDTKIMDFNRAASHILDIEIKRVLGQRLASVLPGVSADLTSYLTRVRDEQTTQALEAEMEVGQRGRVALSMKVSPLRDSVRNAHGIAMVLDDLTEQRDREEIINVSKRYLPPDLVDNIHTISQLALGGERREVTCMYIDARPVNTFPPATRPHQIVKEINVYFARATEIIHEAKGVIDKYMGTEIMVLFNTQLNPTDNHAWKAVQVALDIRDAFVEIYHQQGIDPNPHFYRVGMNTGVATLGNVGSLSRREFTAIGDTINLAKRMEENATDGQILISEDTRQYLEKSEGSTSALHLVELEPIQVKGRKQQTRNYEVFRA
jgi:adenylate cyclase